MRLVSFLTMHTLPTTRAAAVLFGISLYVLSVRAQAGVNPGQPCPPYSDPVVSANLMNFPTPWTIASILPGDTEAQAAWEAMAPGVPNISTKGMSDGNFSDFTPTYSPLDPDCWWTYSGCTTPKIPGIPPDITSMPEPVSLGYGFDDGPNCSHNAFYDFLQENNQLATMFYIGSNCLDWPNECRRGVTDNHQIAVHTWSHRYMTALPSETVFAELWYTRKAIKLITGVTPLIWRSPYGDGDDRTRYIGHAMNLTHVIWSYDSSDWKVASGQATEQEVQNNYNSLIQLATNGSFNKRGTVMLFHELNNGTMDNAIEFYPKLRAAFTGGLIPIATGENMTHPYAETNISVPDYDQYIQSHPISGNSSSTSGGADSGSGKGGAIGIPAISGLVGALAVTAMFLDGLARVIV